MKVSIMETFEKIRELRKSHNLSQEEMADKINLSVSGYRKIENGKSRINHERLEQIAEALEVSPFDLMPNSWGNGHSVYQVGENQFYGDSSSAIEVELLKQQIKFQEQLIEAKDEAIEDKNKLIMRLEEMLKILKP